MKFSISVLKARRKIIHHGDYFFVSGNLFQIVSLQEEETALRSLRADINRGKMHSLTLSFLFYLR